MHVASGNGWRLPESVHPPGRGGQVTVVLEGPPPVDGSQPPQALRLQESPRALDLGELVLQLPIGQPVQILDPELVQHRT
jgi:hypothetical protein